MRASTAPRLIALLVLLQLATACHRSVPMLEEPRRAAVALTGGSNTSMIYVARTSEGVLAIDLGWWGGGRALKRALTSLDATAADVRWVFLTHTHRDHIAAWPAVRHARFHVGNPEQAHLVGRKTHGGWIPRWIERINATATPRPGTLTISVFGQDTILTVGADTIRAYLVPGHTAGSVVYLFRGVLFLGDAVTYSRRGGFAPAKRGYSDDPHAAAENLAALWGRLPRDAVRYACTAHAHCADFTPQFIESIARRGARLGGRDTIRRLP